MQRMERRVARLPATDHEGEAALRVLGEINTVRARTEAFTLVESAAPPGGGLPPHVHNDQDEGIYVLEGEYTLVLEDRRSNLSPGSFASVPRGQPTP
jgi:quercetin dioxygenase-like cupin family protein